MSDTDDDISHIRMVAAISMMLKRGELVRDDAGYMVYWPNDHGCFTAYELRLLADYLDELNKGWDEQVRKELGKP